MDHHISDSSKTKTHIMSLTYKPKIEGVQSDKITQTIRLFHPEKPKKAGDKLILHTWAGKPYRTPWDWRLEIPIHYVFRLKKEGGIWYTSIEPEEKQLYEIIGPWCSQLSVDSLAYHDGIDPPTQEGLEATLKKLNGLASIEGVIWEVIRW